MQAKYIKYKDTGYFSKLITDYLDGDSALDEFIGYDNNLDGYKRIISERNTVAVDRDLLVDRLTVQNKGIELSELSRSNINTLKTKDTFSITTGHQLSFFTGPLYFIYKTASIIKLAIELKEKFPENNFVPVFWMASEDHDFEEINHFRCYNELISWNTSEKGAVGRMKPENIDDALSQFQEALGEGGKRAAYLLELFKRSYSEQDNLAEATRFLVNELFGEYGIVIIDGDDRELKKTMIPLFKKELNEFRSDRNLKATNAGLLLKGYKVQVNQREINLFYLDNNLRERIVFENGKYKVLNTKIEFSKTEIIEELESNPERFSPNAILRPLYEEHVLPNIAYVGGGGELAYWFQLKSNFKDFGVSFPVLVLRNSLMLIKSGQQRRMKSLGLSVNEMFKGVDDLIRIKVLENSDTDIDISEHLEAVNKIFYELLKKYSSDQSLLPSIKAQHKKQIKGLYELEKKLLRAEKRKQSELVAKIEKLKSDLFPKNVLQERKVNFAEMYMEFGEDLISGIMQNIIVLDNEFAVMH
ncbi:MAG: bacillithiol biosynthesis cysteine-adding enzyme BshC [Bacteroidota bacterium]